jgi:hypothetical protein
MVSGVDFDGFGVGKYSLLVVLGRKGTVALLLPVLSGLFDVHLLNMPNTHPFRFTHHSNSRTL